MTGISTASSSWRDFSLSADLVAPAEGDSTAKSIMWQSVGLVAALAPLALSGAAPASKVDAGEFAQMLGNGGVTAGIVLGSIGAASVVLTSGLGRAQLALRRWRASRGVEEWLKRSGWGLRGPTIAEDWAVRAVAMAGQDGAPRNTMFNSSVVAVPGPMGQLGGAVDKVADAEVWHRWMTAGGLGSAGSGEENELLGQERPGWV